MIVLVDNEAAKVRIDPDSKLVRVDGVILFKRIIKPDGSIVLQCKDSDRLRSDKRGTALIEIPLDKFVEALQQNALLWPY